MKNVHQPDVFIAFSGRMELTSKPKVGIVQRVAIITAAAEAIGELNADLADLRLITDIIVPSAQAAIDGRCKQ